MKYAFFDITEAWEKKLILKKFPKKDVKFFTEPLQEVDAKHLKTIDVISVFIYSKCNKDQLVKLPKLKFVSTRSTGFDHIDLDYCKKNKIQVASVPYYGENTVAEFTFGLLINISRKLDQSVSRVKSGTFDYSGLRGWDLKNKTIGILGFGHIGQKLAKMCKGFEMKVIAYDPFADKLQEVAKELDVKLVDIDSLFKKSDIVSLHMPLIEQTKHILNKNAFNKMKKGVIILNTSRGGLIKTKDLLDALDKDKVSFVAVDVLESENLIKQKYYILDENQNIENLQKILQDQELIKRHNVYVTPHNAFNTIDALERILKTTLENIENFVKKQEIPNLVKIN